MCTFRTRECHGLTVMSALCHGLTVMSALWSKSAGHIRPPNEGSPIMGIIYISITGSNVDAKEQHGCKGATWMQRSNMDAKEQHGRKRATWMQRSNMDAKDQHGCQGATWMQRSNMDAKEQHGGQVKYGKTRKKEACREICQSWTPRSCLRGLLDLCQLSALPYALDYQQDEAPDTRGASPPGCSVPRLSVGPSHLWGTYYARAFNIATDYQQDEASDTRGASPPGCPVPRLSVGPSHTRGASPPGCGAPQSSCNIYAS